MSIADRPGLMVGFVGGSVASAGTTFASCFNPDCYSNFRWFPWRIICRFLSGLSCISFRKDYRENARFHGWSSSDVNLPGSWIIIDQCDHVRDQSFFSWLISCLLNALIPYQEQTVFYLELFLVV